MNRKLLSPLVVFLSACTVGPDYVAPPLDIPNNWRNPALVVEDLTNTKWWERFNDPELTALVVRALEANRDIQIAAARVEQFRALYGVSRSALYPEVDASGGYARSQPSETAVPPTNGKDFNSYAIDGGLRWEIDLWGRIRRSNEAALADLLAEEASARGVLLNVVTGVVQAYVELRELDQRLGISKRTLKSRAESLRIARERFKNGVVSQLDIKQAESEYLSVELTIPDLELAIARRESLISVLLGVPPGPINRGKTIDQLNDAVVIPAGLPVDLVKNRPDLIEAEERLKSATAQIGVARAEYYPRLSLTGIFGYLSADFSDWLKSESNEWQIAPGLGVPVFTAGRLENQVKGAEAQAKQAEWAYKLRLLEALREVEDALVGFERGTKRRDLQASQVQVLKGYLSLSQQRYDEGQSDYLDVLDAQRNLFSTELNLSIVEGRLIAEYINLFRALGGGWIQQAEGIR
jgi:multidrug efflux system outer membrane protein